MSQWMPVLVRVEDLEKVTALLSELEASRGDSGYEHAYDIFGVAAAPVAARGRVEDRPVWPTAALERLASSTSATAQRWAKALDVCCESPGDYLATSQVAHASGMTITQWRDASRKISRHLKAHYPDVPTEPSGALSWPLDTGSNPERPNEVAWAASKETAERWKEVRSARS